MASRLCYLIKLCTAWAPSWSPDDSKIVFTSNRDGDYKLYVMNAAALVAGLIADVLLWRLKPSADRLVEFRICAFVVPTVFYSLYFLVVQLSGGINWTIHFWMGSIVLVGVIGLLLSYLLLPPFGVDQERAESTRQK